MKRLRLFAIFALFALGSEKAAMLVSAEGVRLSSDFLPLAAGNRWLYTVTGEDGRKLGEVEFGIQEHRIVAGRSFYVLAGFPFVSDPSEKIEMIGYDRQEREFIRIAGGKEGALFLADGSSTEVLEQDESGLVQKLRLRLDTMTLTFQRGVGIVEARLDTPGGPRRLTLNDARAGEAKLPGNTPTGPVPTITADPPKRGTVSPVTSENPRLQFDAVIAAEQVQIILTVTNTSDQLLPFKFDSGQSYDFWIVDASGREVWRWSRGQFFTAVVRSEALRGRTTWKFEGSWNRNDRSGKPVPAGAYQVKGQLTSQPPLDATTVPLILR